MFLSPALDGETILIAEDEPLIALSVEAALQSAGAHIISEHTLDDALQAIDRQPISAAVLDWVLGGRSVEPACTSLLGKNIPFVIYTGLTFTSNLAPAVHKPARDETLIGAIKFAITANTDELDGGGVPLAPTAEATNLIQQGEARIERLRTISARLARNGYDMSSSDELIRVMTGSLCLLNESRRLMRRSSGPI